ncbi:signal peptidase I [Isachenkonia alkalipeptolytica]|uniref:Signal peptidase I n=1 Tax=Isachenkonia alkalipeptolytica TaxID=2565777 RepID=A0AA43XI94_9CLOT|nr:signal peptidase I [Isachenkonia alkalipeptolytica]NBG87067.1 signal peptidase I [Isachenkonia alkalipeptolytica]
MIREIIEWIKTIVVSILIALLITTFVKPTMVQGQSMEPTLWENDLLIINQLLYNRDEPGRGDIVVFESNQLDEDGKPKLFIKRVIGLPEEEITISDGKVYINNDILSEDYLAEEYTHGDIKEIIPENKIFVIGDNRSSSLDSRSPEIGIIDFEDIVGQAVMRLYPFEGLGKIE